MSAAVVGGGYVATRLCYGAAVRANRYDLLGMFTAPGYFATVFLALGPVHSQIMTRKLGFGTYTSAAILTGGFVAFMMGTMRYARSFREVASAEGGSCEPDPTKDGRPLVKK